MTADVRALGLALGLALAALGLGAAVAALSIGGWGADAWGPRTVPLLAALALLLSGLAVARVRPAPPSPSPSPTAARPPRAVVGEPPAADGPDGAAGTMTGERGNERGNERGVALLLGLAVLYVLGIDRVGYLVATALAAPAAFALFGVRRPLPLLAAAVVVPLALYLAFFRVLGVFPPLGAWFDLTDHLPL